MRKTAMDGSASHHRHPNHNRFGSHYVNDGAASNEIMLLSGPLDAPPSLAVDAHGGPLPVMRAGPPSRSFG